MHDLCSYYLYDDILVGNANTLVQDLDGKCPKAKLLNQVKTLQLYHPIVPATPHPSYVDLLVQDAWQWMDLSRWPNDHSNLIELASGDKDFANELWLRPAGLTFNKQMMTGDMRFARMMEATGYGEKNRPLLGDQAFATLTRVIMTGVGDQTWGRHGQDYGFDVDEIFAPTEEYYLRGVGMPYKDDNRPAPHFLLGHPSVKHYCQTTQAGPLALSGNVIKLINPPEIVTYHLNQDILSPSLYMHLLPVVMGSVNRYIFDSPSCVITDIPPTATRTVEGLLANEFEAIEYMLRARQECLYLYPSGFDYMRMDNEKVCSLETTSIELYNCIDYIWLGKDDYSDMSIPPPSPVRIDLTPIETMLNEDERLGPWKGRVHLKNIGECPPCSACGKEQPLDVDIPSA
jgi:hypothetical protein